MKDEVDILGSSSLIQKVVVLNGLCGRKAVSNLNIGVRDVWKMKWTS